MISGNIENLTIPARHIQGKMEIEGGQSPFTSKGVVVDLENAKQLKVKLENKNLLPFPYKEGNLEKNGVKITTLQDGRVKIKGTATSNFLIKLYDDPNGFVIPDSFISGVTKGSTTPLTYYMQVLIDGKNCPAIATQGVAVKGGKVTRVIVQMMSGAVIDEVIEPMIAEGSAATPYTQYVKNWAKDPVPFGKNLFPTQFLRAYKDVEGGNTLTVSGYNVKVHKVANHRLDTQQNLFLKAGNYILQGGFPSTQTPYFIIGYKDKEGIYQWVYNRGKFNLSTDQEIIVRLFANVNLEGDWSANFQLEEGVYSTNFELPRSETKGVRVTVGSKNLADDSQHTLNNEHNIEDLYSRGYFIEPGIYTLSYQNTDILPNGIYVYNRAGFRPLAWAYNRNQLTFTITEAQKVFFRIIDNTKGITEDTRGNWQLEYGKESTPYVPYIKPTNYVANAEGYVNNIPDLLNKALYSTPIGYSLTATGIQPRAALVATSNDNLVGFTIDRESAEGKFFGYGISQKIEVKLNDKDKTIASNLNNKMKAYLSVESEPYVDNFPKFIINEAKRDENTNGLTLIGYDLLNEATKHLVNELTFNTTNITVNKYIEAITTFFGNSFSLVNIPSNDYNLNYIYPEGANLSGKETIRELLDDIAEVLQCIYYVDSKERLVFKRLSPGGNVIYPIEKKSYFSLKSEGDKTIESICKTTELGDNIQVGEGLTQYVRDNAFWDKMAEDKMPRALNSAIAAVSDLTINQFTCNWRGNHYLELGDKISFTAKDNSTIETYLLKDKFIYNGSLSQTTSWKYGEGKAATHTNPTTLGEKLKMTAAKVDKTNNIIELTASKTENNAQEISNLILDTQKIQASVKAVETQRETDIKGVNERLTTLTQEVSQQITPEGVDLEVRKVLSEGVDKVTTSAKHFTFDDKGLNISNPENNKVSTQIDEKGMKVKNSNDDVLLEATDVGVKAENLHATTYLIIGTNSRFEDYGKRTGCFWIG